MFSLMALYKRSRMCCFPPDACMEFGQTGDYLNWTITKNASSPVREFWEWVWIKNSKIWPRALKVWLIFDWNWHLQEKNFECHRKCPWVRQHAMGVGFVPSVILDGLLLLRLERSKVHREGTPRNFFCVVCKISISSGTVMQGDTLENG